MFANEEKTKNAVVFVMEHSLLHASRGQTVLIGLPVTRDFNTRDYIYQGGIIKNN